MPVGSLESSLGFTDPDLAANRDGALSSAQSSRLLTSAIWRLVVGPPLIVGGAFAALLADTAIWAVIGLVVSAAGLYLTWRGFEFVVDSRDGAVAFVTAPLKKRTVHTKNGMSYFADVGPVTKRVSAASFNALDDGTVLHLYYAPGCRSLLSVEPASAAEPKPPHPFGPDSAHAWDRLRWSWVLMTMGALGILIGLHQVVVAHPAHPVAVEGVMTDYYESHGKTTTRTMYMNDGNTYTPKDEYSYDPPAPAWDSLIGQQVTLYVNAGSSDVLAVNVGGQLYAGDWYEHPEHQTTFEVMNGWIVVAAAALIGALGVLLMVRDRRSAETVPGADGLGRPARYAPPTVHTTGSFLSGTVALLICLGAFGGFIAIALASKK